MSAVADLAAVQGLGMMAADPGPAGRAVRYALSVALAGVVLAGMVLAGMVLAGMVLAGGPVAAPVRPVGELIAVAGLAAVAWRPRVRVRRVPSRVLSSRVLSRRVPGRRVPASVAAAVDVAALGDAGVGGVRRAFGHC